MEKKPMDTMWITDGIGKCETLADFKKEFEKEIYENFSFYSDWENHISTLLRKHALTATDIARGLNISKASASRFIESIPSKRKNVIMIAMMFGMNLDETNELLVRWAKFQKLYVKNPEDAIWIYLINNKKFYMPALAFSLLHRKYLTLTSDGNTASASGNQNTMKLTDELLEINNDDTFMVWMKKQIPSHKNYCNKLINCIDTFLANESINQWFKESEKSKRDKYYRVLRDLKEKGRIPERDILISLGLKLRLGTGKINELLDAAGMGPLLAKDQLEGLVMFFIEELYCKYPSMFPENDNIGILLFDEEPDTVDTFGEPDEFPADDISDYIKTHIEECGIVFRESNRVKEFLDTL